MASRRRSPTLEVTEAINRPPGHIVRSCDPGPPTASAQLHAERQAAVQLDLRDLDRAIANLSQLDPTDPQRNELRVAQEALGSLRATLRGLGLFAEAAERGATRQRACRRCELHVAEPSRSDRLLHSFATAWAGGV